MFNAWRTIMEQLKEHIANVAPPKRKPLDILAILSYRRPHGSKSEKKFINKFIKPLGVFADEYGNLMKTVGGTPKIMWSCHTDTVHHTPGRQRIVFNPVDHKLKVSEAEKSRECLGADDGAGVFLLREMILAKVPGLYVFHRNEEHGCLGAKALLANNRTLLDGIKYAVAFDRRGTKSIITHQRSRRMCSEEFAESLNKLLGGTFETDPTGTFTDTATYADIIPECTNVSVGYDNAHSPRESLDVQHLLNLRNNLCAITATCIDTLVAKRDPSVYESRWGTNDYGWRHPNGSPRMWEDDWGYYGNWDKDEDEKKPTQRSGITLHSEQPFVKRWGHSDYKPARSDPSPREVEVDLKEYNLPRNFRHIVEEFPEATVAFLEDLGVEGSALAQYILDMFGPGALDE